MSVRGRRRAAPRRTRCTDTWQGGEPSVPSAAEVEPGAATTETAASWRVPLQRARQRHGIDVLALELAELEDAALEMAQLTAGFGRPEQLLEEPGRARRHRRLDPHAIALARGQDETAHH